MLINLTLFTIFIILSAFFSSSETAIFSLSKVKLRHLQEKYPQAKKLKILLKKPTRLLSTIVFGNMLVNIAISSLFTAILVKKLGEEGLILAIFLTSIIILFLGEIFPKLLAIYNSEKISLASSPLLTSLSQLLLPFLLVIEKIVEVFSLKFIPSFKSSGGDEELKTALLIGKKEGHISPEEEEMISYVLEFKDTKVSEILTARIDIQGIDSSLSSSEVIKILKEIKHSKLPVYKGSLDNIVGILYAKELFLNPEKNYHSLLREPIFVPESKKIVDLLKTFLERNERIAIVLDEYGGTQGLVTLEDIEEEIFGEIYDEFETPKKPIEKIEKNIWRIYGKTPLKTVNIELDLALPEEEDTLAGFLLSKIERIPRSGEKFNFQNLEFIIERATARRIVSVIIKKE